MWNKEKVIRLVKVVTKEYSKNIIAEESKSVMGLEDHIDRIIAEILEVKSNIVIVAREQKKVIKRVAITEEINRVKSMLEQENKKTIARREETTIQETKTDIIILDQTDSTKLEDNIELVEALIKEDSLLINKKIKYTII